MLTALRAMCTADRWLPFSLPANPRKRQGNHFIKMCHLIKNCSARLLDLIDNQDLSHKAYLSCAAGAGGGKPAQRPGCFCRRPPAGGGQIAGLPPWQPASDPARGAGGRIVAGTTVQHKLSPTGRWVGGDLEL